MLVQSLMLLLCSLVVSLSRSVSLHEREVQSLIDAGSCSDSFYFVNNKLIMHNKARYQYIDAAREDGSSSSSKKRAQ
jgi:hypothetical protein